MTLLEALVVVAVTAMVGAITFPNLGRMLDAARLRQAAGTLQADLRIARAEAVGRDQRVEVDLSTDNHGYGWGGVEKSRTPPGVVLARTSSDPLTFFADGSASGGGLVVASPSRRIVVSVDPATGAVSAAAS